MGCLFRRIDLEVYHTNFFLETLFCDVYQSVPSLSIETDWFFFFAFTLGHLTCSLQEKETCYFGPEQEETEYFFLIIKEKNMTAVLNGHILFAKCLVSPTFHSWGLMRRDFKRTMFCALRTIEWTAHLNCLLLKFWKHCFYLEENCYRNISHVQSGFKSVFI